MARVKQIIGWTAIVLFVATLAGIWVLTEQNAVETSLLSESTARVVEGQATGVQAADATGEAQTENGMTGGADSAASNVRSGRLASIRMWVGTNVRRVAHTVEFFFVGMFASDAQLIDFASRALRIYCGAMFIFGIQTSCQMTFVSIGYALCSIIVAVMRKFVLLIPLIYIMPQLLSDKVSAVYAAEPVADSLAVIFTAVMFAVNFKKALRKMEEK